MGGWIAPDHIVRPFGQSYLVSSRQVYENKAPEVDAVRPCNRLWNMQYNDAADLFSFIHHYDTSVDMLSQVLKLPQVIISY